jgi:RNA polymerase sigma-70 factor (ECF subfamily)
MRQPLTDALLSAARPKARPVLARGAHLEELLRGLVVAARGTWAGVGLDDQAFLTHLGAQLPDSPEAVNALRELHVEELFLARACAGRDPQALALFDRHYLAATGKAVGRLDQSRALTDEVQQELRQKLFLDQPPKILEYSGKGSLVGWLRAVAVRAALNQRRGAKAAPPVDPDEALAVPTLQKDPEVALIQGRYREEFRAAFSEALSALSSRERNVLRLSSLDGLSIDEIGRLFQVHRATAARWLTRSREFLLDETRRRLAERLQLGSREADSLIGALRSQLDVSIHRLLRDEKESDS